MSTARGPLTMDGRMAAPTIAVLVMTLGVVGPLDQVIDSTGVTKISAEIALEEEGAIRAETVIEAKNGKEAETEQVAGVVTGEVDHDGGAAHAAGGGAIPGDDPETETASTGGDRHHIADAPQVIGADEAGHH